MDRDDQPAGHERELSARAEEMVRSLSSPDGDFFHVSPDQVRRLLHELHVRQAELEIQNEELRRAQFDLENSRDKYADLYDFAPVGYITLDQRGVILEANLTAASLMNQERPALIGKPLMTRITVDDHPTLFKHLSQVFSTPGPQVCEVKLRPFIGRQVTARFESVVVKRGEIASAACLSALSDITEIHRLQEAVLATRDEILNSMGEGVSLCDETGVISFTNAAFDLMFGYDRNELLRNNLVSLHAKRHEGGSTSLLTVLDEAIARGYWRGELVGCRKDATVFDALVRMSATKLFGTTSLITVWEDVSALKRAERALNESEQRLRAIFEGATDVIFLKDASFRYTHVNPAFVRLLGKSAARLVDRTYEDLFGEEGAAYERDVDTRVLAGETIEEQYTRKIGGATFRFHEVRIPLRGMEGKVVGLAGIARDITERRERELEQRPKSDMPRSKAMKATVDLAVRAAKMASVVLLLGESGSGKDHLARFIHNHSDRPGGPYFSINCAAVPHELAESELFGHERGAFTGAHARKRGLLELAEGGTLVLNEIGDLSLPLQAKLLTFLDTKRFTRVGGEKEISVNARLIAATNKDLEEEVKAGRFREDLNYRLSVMVIRIPPLRERIEDLPQLVEDLVKQLAVDFNLADAPVFDRTMLDSFRQYRWPGNIRELKNALERALLVGDLPTMDNTPPADVPSSIHSGDDFPVTVRFSPGRTLRDLTGEVTRAVCLEALRRSNGNKKKAASLLGIARDSLHRYIKNFGIEVENSAE